MINDYTVFHTVGNFCQKYFCLATISIGAKFVHTTVLSVEIILIYKIVHVY